MLEVVTMSLEILMLPLRLYRQRSLPIKADLALIQQPEFSEPLLSSVFLPIRIKHTDNHPVKIDEK